MDSERPPSWQLATVLTAAVLAIGASAVIVRGIEGVPALGIALVRCLGAGAVQAVALRPMARPDAVKVGVAGVALAAHFVAWFESLRMTTVLHATVLVCLTPLWVGAWEWLRGRPPGARFLGGVSLAVAGIGAMSAGSAGGGVSLAGDALALFSGWLATVYFLLSREVRARAGTGTVGAATCIAAAAALLPWGFTLDVAWTELSSQTWALLGLTVLVPQLVGHNGFNWALKHLPATLVSSFILLEPVAATVLAIPFLGEWPDVGGMVGGLLVLAGVAWAGR